MKFFRFSFVCMLSSARSQLLLSDFKRTETVYRGHKGHRFALATISKSCGSKTLRNQAELSTSPSSRFAELMQAAQAGSQKTSPAVPSILRWALFSLARTRSVIARSFSPKAFQIPGLRDMSACSEASTSWLGQIRRLAAGISAALFHQLDGCRG